MNSIFLRIYGGMCAALVLVAVLGVLALHLLNQTRSEQYRERLAHGTFSLMADNLRPMNGTERRRALAVWERLLGIPWPCRRFPRPTWTSASAPAYCAARHWWSRPGRTRQKSIGWSMMPSN